MGFLYTQLLGFKRQLMNLIIPVQGNRTFWSGIGCGFIIFSLEQGMIQSRTDMASLCHSVWNRVGNISLQQKGRTCGVEKVDSKCYIHAKTGDTLINLLIIQTFGVQGKESNVFHSFLTVSLRLNINGLIYDHLFKLAEAIDSCGRLAFSIKGSLSVLHIQTILIIIKSVS